MDAPFSVQIFWSGEQTALYAFGQRANLFFDRMGRPEKRFVRLSGRVVQPPVLTVAAGQKRALYPATHGDEHINGRQFG